MRMRASRASTRAPRSAVPGVIAVVTGELLAQHKLAWMPTLSGDTQAVLATDKVRFQGQEVACVIAETKYIAEDAAALVSRRLRAAAGDHDAAAGDRAGRHRDPRREGRPDRQQDLPLGGGRQGRDRRRVRARGQGGEPRDVLPALPSVAARDVRLRRRPRPGDRQRDHLHDEPGAARAPHALRDRRRACPRRRSGSSRRISVVDSATRCRSIPDTWSPRRHRC